MLLSRVLLQVVYSDQHSLAQVYILALPFSIQLSSSSLRDLLAYPHSIAGVLNMLHFCSFLIDGIYYKTNKPFLQVSASLHQVDPLTGRIMHTASNNQLTVRNGLYFPYLQEIRASICLVVCLSQANVSFGCHYSLH